MILPGKRRAETREMKLKLGVTDTGIGCFGFVFFKKEKEKKKTVLESKRTRKLQRGILFLSRYVRMRPLTHKLSCL